MKELIIEAEPDETFYGACERVKEKLYGLNDYKDLKFNDITVTIRRYSDYTDLCVIYALKYELRKFQTTNNE